MTHLCVRAGGFCIGIRREPKQSYLSSSSSPGAEKQMSCFDLSLDNSPTDNVQCVTNLRRGTWKAEKILPYVFLHKNNFHFGYFRRVYLQRSSKQATRLLSVQRKRLLIQTKTNVHSSKRATEIQDRFICTIGFLWKTVQSYNKQLITV